ncbi:MAG: AMP-binding protein, partial [bacterium]|nr:AMP-binding protein [bacterium]
MRTYNSLVEAFQASRDTGKGMTCVNRSDDEHVVSYHDLYHQALIILHNLRQQGVACHDEVVLQLNDVQAFVSVFWACVLGKIIPIPLAVGNTDDKRRKVFNVWQRLSNPTLIADDADALATFGEFVEENGGEFTTIRHRALTYQDVIVGSAEADIEHVRPDDIAYIQFSSGSTGSPKGVVLTHRNLLTNLYDILQHLHITSDDSFLSWKPLTHDFSLIAFHIAPIVAGCEHCLIPTMTFIWNPAIWFSKVNQYRSSILGSPNFGFRHFLKLYTRKKGREHWDLSCVRHIMNGAEPISPQLCRDFSDEMAQYHLKRTSMLPGYGLAEASLFVSSNPPDSGVRIHTLDRRFLNVGDALHRISAERSPYAIKVVDVGCHLDNGDVRITDEHDRPLEEDIVGYIQIQGEHVTQGYYNNVKATEELFTRDGWMNTGDLGFISDGRLTITGRAREIIFIAGINYYPHDIEQIILENTDKNDLNKYIVCGVHNDYSEREEILIFVHFKKGLKGFISIAERLKTIVLENMGLFVDKVIPVPHIPKTTSGKTQRFKLGQRYKNGEFDPIIHTLNRLSVGARNGENFGTLLRGQGREFLTAFIRKQTENIIGETIEDIDRPFNDLGLKSLHVPQLQQVLEIAFNLKLPVSLVFDYPTIRMLADHLSHRVFQDDVEEMPGSPQALG